MSKTIDKQGIKGGLVYCTNEPIVVRLGQIKAVRRNGGISAMCLRQLRGKALREGWDIVPMGQWESSHPCLRIGQSYAAMKMAGLIQSV